MMDTFDASLGEIHSKPLSGGDHSLTPLVVEKVRKCTSFMFEPLDLRQWIVAHKEDDMIVYRRELEIENMVVDPLRASYTVPGVTALEMVKYFYDVETRLDWDGTVESVEAIEKLAEDTVVFHQLHKRVWPSVQRESLFCSHLCLLTDAPCPDNMVGDTMMVCNFSVDHDKVPASSKLIRISLHVGLVGQTVSSKPEKAAEELTREDVSCKFIYTANVNPGGWAPPAVVRMIAKREICKFIKTFSRCARNHFSSMPLALRL